VIQAEFGMKKCTPIIPSYEFKLFILIWLVCLGEVGLQNSVHFKIIFFNFSPHHAMFQSDFLSCSTPSWLGLIA
jgi:hypothetical protein